MASEADSSVPVQPGQGSSLETTSDPNTDSETCETDVAGEENVHEEETETSLSLDVTFDIVKNERRRLVLEYLDRKDGAATLGELAEHIAAIENDKDVQAINSAERKRVYVGLYQCHLPKMEAADVIDSERNSKITLSKNADDVMQYVGEKETATRPWHRYYLSLSAVGLFAMGAFAAIGFATMVIPVAGVVILALLVVAVVHTNQSGR